MKISVIKFETIDGKKVGKEFSFPMDAKKMARYKTEATVKKKVEEYIVKSGIFRREELGSLKYDMKDFLEEWRKQVKIVEEETLKELEESANKKETRVTPEFYLDRFVDAQTQAYEIALNEIRNGRKMSHWIWYIFPQQKGLGHSHNSEFYGLEGIEEAAAYWAHPVLGPRLREISEALLTHRGKRGIDFIMGSHVDVLKLQTCMNLFNKVAPNDVFKEVLEAFF